MTVVSLFIRLSAFSQQSCFSAIFFCRSSHFALSSHCFVADFGRTCTKPITIATVVTFFSDHLFSIRDFLLCSMFLAFRKVLLDFHGLAMCGQIGYIKPCIFESILVNLYISVLLSSLRACTVCIQNPVVYPNEVANTAAEEPRTAVSNCRIFGIIRLQCPLPRPFHHAGSSSR